MLVGASSTIFSTSYNVLMRSLKKLQAKIARARDAWSKRRQLMFPSPAEVEFIRIFGGRYITFSRVKDPDTGYPLTIVTNLGVVLKRELIRREIRVGRYFIDFGQITPWDRRGIKIEDRLDVVKYQELDDYVRGLDWSLFHLEAAAVFREPMRVQQRVLEWLAK